MCESSGVCSRYGVHEEYTGAAERTPLFEKQINSKPKKIQQIFSISRKHHRMPFYINVF